MKLLHGGIHKRVGFIIQHSGGYDREYHISKVSKDLNINREVIRNLFREASYSNLPRYIELLKRRVSIDAVFKLVDYDNMLIDAKLRSIESICELVISKSRCVY